MIKTAGIFSGWVVGAVYYKFTGDDRLVNIFADAADSIRPSDLNGCRHLKFEARQECARTNKRKREAGIFNLAEQIQKTN